MASAVPPQNFALDRNIFNDSLYAHIRSFWFAEAPKGAKHGGFASLKKWWGIGGRTEEEAAAFDAECRKNYGSILETIGPASIALPPFKSYEDELERVQDLAAPFLTEVDGKENGAERLLSLVLLLDQMPRNIYRDPEGLKLVYKHYDRLAWSLVRGSANLKPNPLEHPSSRGNLLAKNWLGMPLLHAEDLKSQELAMSRLKECVAEAREDGDKETAKEAEMGLTPAGQHLDIIKRFGRFPHRNEFLGRRNTEEEDEWLKDGETFGVKQSKKPQNKDEL